MEITNRGVNSNPLTPKTPVEAVTPAPSAPAAPSSAAPSSSYTPSPELVRLLDKVRAQPDVRPDRVQAASERLQQGYYNTSTSIAQTAEAMVHCGEW
jgi:hypothetical protein